MRCVTISLVLSLHLSLFFDSEKLSRKLSHSLNVIMIVPSLLCSALTVTLLHDMVLISRPTCTSNCSILKVLLLIWSYLAFFEPWCRSRQPFSHFLTQQIFIASNYFYYQVINHCWVYLFSPIPNTDAIRICRISNPSDGHYSVSLY